ncbi:MAG: hypothetical protein ACFB9M_20080 [Myxococcota bacterium]
MSRRFLVIAKSREGIVEFSDDAGRAALLLETEKREATPSEIGSSFWDAMKKAGVDPLSQNQFIIHENDREGTLIASLHPVLEGARVVWLVLYRADRNASCFKPLGSRQRIADALDLAFGQLIQEIKRPHKP